MYNRSHSESTVQSWPLLVSRTRVLTKSEQQNEAERQMVGESESSASLILCSAEHEPAGLTACQSHRPRGRDLEMTALSPPLSVFDTSPSLSFSLCHSITCVQPHADLSPPPCFPCLSSTKQARGGGGRGTEKEKKTHIPLQPTSLPSPMC